MFIKKNNLLSYIKYFDIFLNFSSLLHKNFKDFVSDPVVALSIFFVNKKNLTYLTTTLTTNIRGV